MSWFFTRSAFFSAEVCEEVYPSLYLYAYSRELFLLLLFSRGIYLWRVNHTHHGECPSLSHMYLLFTSSGCPVRLSHCFTIFCYILKPILSISESPHTSSIALISLTMKQGRQATQNLVRKVDSRNSPTTRLVVRPKIGKLSLKPYLRFLS